MLHRALSNVTKTPPYVKPLSMLSSKISTGNTHTPASAIPSEKSTTPSSITRTARAASGVSNETPKLPSQPEPIITDDDPDFVEISDDGADSSDDEPVVPNRRRRINTKDPAPPGASIEAPLRKRTVNDAIDTDNHSGDEALPPSKRPKGFELIPTMGVTRKSQKGAVLRWGKERQSYFQARGTDGQVDATRMFRYLRECGAELKMMKACKKDLLSGPQSRYFNCMLIV